MLPRAFFSFLFVAVSFIIVIIFCFCFAAAEAVRAVHGESNNDTQALLAFGASSGAMAAGLQGWNSSGGDCCGWEGVSCTGIRVTRLSLRGKNLRGSIDALLLLTELRVLILSGNAFHGPLFGSSISIASSSSTNSISRSSISIASSSSSSTSSISRSSISISIASNWNHLWFLILPSNGFSGPIPTSISALPRLRSLDLSRNSFEASIPASLSALSRLRSLHLHRNNLSGSIPDLALPDLASFDVSFNELLGPIPASLRRFPSSSFGSNLGLCGIPLPPCTSSNNNGSSSSNNGSSNDGHGDVSSSPASPFASIPSIVSSSTTAAAAPSSSTTSLQRGRSGAAAALAQIRSSNSSKLGLGAIVAIVVGDVILLLVLTVVFVVYYQRSKGSSRTLGGSAGFGGGAAAGDGAAAGTSLGLGLGLSDCKPGGGGGSKFNLAQDMSCLPGHGKAGVRAESLRDNKAEKKKLVFLDDDDDGYGDANADGSKMKRFELEDLLRASAEMLGKGSLGTAYKAVMEDGSCVAVKRLKESNASSSSVALSSSSSLAWSKKEFEQRMEAIGRVRRHPNLVALRAYYYAKEEKLLVYDFMPNGSLFNLLHGSRGPGGVALEWGMRVRIAAGAARGVARLHACQLAHGNIKSANVLLGGAWEARVSDYALAPGSGSGPGSSSSSSSSSSGMTSAAATATGMTSATATATGMTSATATAMATGYEAPELVPAAAGQLSHHAAAAAADVYSFGVLLLEMVTGRAPAQCVHDDGLELPRWVQSVVREEWTAEVLDLDLLALFKDREPEMVAMLQMGMACCDPSPALRPPMSRVARMIRAISRAHPPPHHPLADRFTPVREDEGRGCGSCSTSGTSSSSSSPQSIQP